MAARLLRFHAVGFAALHFVAAEYSNQPSAEWAGGGPATGDFDCHAGLSNCELGWTAAKKDWCYFHRGIGCKVVPYKGNEAHFSIQAVDRLHEECWTTGNCQDDGSNVCSWCGQHHGESMYCCRVDWSYDPGQNCYGALHSASDHHQCVPKVPAPVPTPAPPTPRPTPVDRLHEECWTTGGCQDDGAHLCGWCGLHNGESMYCCRDDWSYRPGHNCYGISHRGSSNHHQCVQQDDKQLPPPQYGPQYHALYDCDAGYSNWKEGWSSTKKHWCCQHAGVACQIHHHGNADKPFFCDDDPVSQWAITKKLWCCKNEHKGCTDDQYDCEAGYSRWQTGWSPSKKSWCCQHKQRGCEFHYYDCEAGSGRGTVVWSSAKRLWCCENKRAGCDQPAYDDPYDCDAGYDRWQEGWSPSKKKWCCKHKQRGCEFHYYDCEAGSGRGTVAWSSAKRLWCCENKQKGCDQGSHEKAVDDKEWGLTKADLMPYDCNAGYENWHNGWSHRKQSWCCKHENRGCGQVRALSSTPMSERWNALLRSSPMTYAGLAAALALAMVVLGGVFAWSNLNRLPRSLQNDPRNLSQGAYDGVPELMGDRGRLSEPVPHM